MYDKWPAACVSLLPTVLAIGIHATSVSRPCSHMRGIYTIAMSFCLSVCSSVCRLRNFLMPKSFATRGSNWQRAGAYRIVSDTLVYNQNKSLFGFWCCCGNWKSVKCEDVDDSMNWNEGRLSNKISRELKCPRWGEKLTEPGNVREEYVPDICRTFPGAMSYIISVKSGNYQRKWDSKPIMLYSIKTRCIVCSHDSRYDMRPCIYICLAQVRQNRPIYWCHLCVTASLVWNFHNHNNSYICPHP